MIRIGLLGARGRMGQWVSKLLAHDYASQASLSAQANRGEPITPLLDTDAVIDFSSPESFLSVTHEALMTSGGTLPVFIVGSTGWNPEGVEQVRKLAKKTPVLMSSNFSVGVLALQQILKSHAAMLARLGYTPVMLESHHQHKKDAPSGTALMLNRTLEAAIQGPSVQTHSIRAGEIIGDHEITFHGPADRIVLGHSAQDRSVFARGALDAALWLHRNRERLSTERKVLSMETYFAELENRK